MPDPLLTEGDYPSIRRKVGFPDGTDDFLPVTKIGDAQYVGKAEEWVADRADLGSLDAGQAKHAKLAAVYYAAYLLLPDSLGELQAAFNAVSGGAGASVSGWQARWKRLLEQAEEEIAAITTAEFVDAVGVPGTSAARVSISF